MMKSSKKPRLEEMADWQVCLRLFLITLKLSACTFGGGFVIIGMMKRKFVQGLEWLSDEEMLDMTAIAQSSPGALGVNIAIVVGYRLKKFVGALCATLGAVIPPLVIISVLSLFYNEFKDNTYIAIALQVMRAGVAAVVCDVVIDLAKNIFRTKSVLWIGIMFAAFIASYFLGVSAIVIILVCAAAGLVYAQYSGRKERQS